MLHARKFTACTTVFIMERDPLFNFRQPLVTAAGIILGFVLNFATDLVKFSKRNDVVAWIILLSVAMGIVFMLLALYRILNHNYHRQKPAVYYGRTLRIFMAGVILAFSGGLVKMIQTLLIV